MFAREPLADSEDKIIERLGDCDVPVDYMDLLSHRIRCHKIEIFHYDDEVSFTANDEEEEQELSVCPKSSEDRTDDEDRTLQLAKDLDCLIRRIEQMQIVIKERKKQQDLKTEQTEESSEQKEKQKQSAKPEKQEHQIQEQKKNPSNEELSCEEQLEVRNLQHGHHRLQCQIDEMIGSYRLLRDLLKKLRGQLCQENKRVRKLGVVIIQFHDWSQQVAKELPVCKQRYQTLLQKKLTKTEAARVIKANIVKAYKRGKTFLSNRQLQFDLREFLAEINELTEYANDLRQEMDRRFSHIENETTLPRSHVDSISSQMTTSLEKD